MAKEETKKNKNVKSSKKKVQKESYLKQVRKELSLVKWPTAKDVIKYSLSTIIFCLLICGFFILLNLILSGVMGVFQ